MDDDIMAMLKGLDRGNASFQGLMPSAGNVGGAPAAVDPAAPLLDECYRCLSQAIASLNNMHREGDANKLLGALKQVSGLQQECRKRFAEDAKTGSGAGGMNAVGGMNAMGIPQ